MKSNALREELNSNTIKSLNSISFRPEDYAAIYARQSSQEEKQSLTLQVEHCLKRLENENLLLYDIYQEKVSGNQVRFDERGQFKKLINDLEAGAFKTIIVLRRDRLTRRMQDYFEIKRIIERNEARILFAQEGEFDSSTKSYVSNFVDNILVAISALEAERIAMRTQDGKDQARSCGHWTSHPPFGFRKVRSSDRRYKSTCMPIVFMRPAIKQLFEDYLNKVTKEKGYSFSTLTTEFSKNLKAVSEKSPFNSKSTVWSKPVLTEKSIETYLKKAKLHYLAAKENRSNGAKRNLLKRKKVSFSNISSTFIKNILKNPTYAGYIRAEGGLELQDMVRKNAGGEYYVAMDLLIKSPNIQPIIDIDLWQKCLLKLYSETKFQKPKSNFFGDKLKCKSCKGSFTLEENIFSCSKRCVCISSENLLHQLYKQMVNDITDNRIKSHLEQGISRTDGELKKLQAGIKDLIQQLRKYTLELVGLCKGPEKDQLERKIIDTHDKLKATKSIINTLGKGKFLCNHYLDNVEIFRNRCLEGSSYLESNWENVDSFVSRLVDKVIIKPGSKGGIEFEYGFIK